MSKVIRLQDPWVYAECVRTLREGGILCAPTDTIYGLLADATNRQALERLYRIRRPSNRPFIILLPHTEWLYSFKPLILDKHLKLFFMGITLILYPRTRFPAYLTRNGRSLAFRIPPQETFVGKLLKEFNRPVVAPSANPEGEKPASTVEEALAYFGDKVDLYVDGGRVEGKPSTIFKLIGYRCLRLVREGKTDPREVIRTLKSL